VITAFGIEGLGYENVRIRIFNKATDLFQKEYGGDKEGFSLRDLEIENYNVLGVEVKNSNEEFEPYTDDTVTVKIILWEENISSEAQTNLE
jgi:hypothetical protein